jgi:hypothetical protein
MFLHDGDCLCDGESDAGMKTRWPEDEKKSQHRGTYKYYWAFAFPLHKARAS